jgi:hypothetical protein
MELVIRKVRPKAMILTSHICQKKLCAAEASYVMTVIAADTDPQEE